MRGIDYLALDNCPIPPEDIYAILDRADKLIEEEIRAFYAANRAWGLSAKERLSTRQALRDAREWRNSDAAPPT